MATPVLARLYETARDHFATSSTAREIGAVTAQGAAGIGAPIVAWCVTADAVLRVVAAFAAICVSSAMFFSILLTIRRKQREAIDAANRADRRIVEESYFAAKRKSKSKHQRRDAGA